MKSIVNICAALGVAAAGLSLASCQADIDAPSLQVPVSDMTPNTTIADFKTAFADVATVEQIGTRQDGSHYIIHGNVISCDATGNMYQSMVIQDATAAIEFSISRGSLYTIYPVGQEVVVDLTGLWVGLDGVQKIGDYYAQSGTPKVGRMLYPVFEAHSQLNGLPDLDVKYVRLGNPAPADNPYCIIATIEQLPSAGEALRNMQDQLVEFQNVHFEGAGELTYSIYQSSGENRTLVDRNGQTLTVRTSGYSTFYNQLLPEGEGTVRGILGYYNEAWQLILRSPEDVMFGSKGKKEDPYTVEEAIAMNNNGTTAWVEGYVVGAGKAGAQAVTPETVVWGADGLIFEGNVLIAPAADCRDLSLCMAVELPAGSRLRQYVNLLDNPQVLGRLLKVNGTMMPYLGIHGVAESGGTFADFTVVGMEINDPNGLGEKDYPYTCNYVLEHYKTDTSTTAWFGGYVVGYVTGTDYTAGVHFGIPAADADYNNANLVLAPAPECTDSSLCIVLKISDRTIRNDLGLKAHPEMLGRMLLIQGTLGEYLGHAGIVTITNYQK